MYTHHMHRLNMRYWITCIKIDLVSVALLTLLAVGWWFGCHEFYFWIYKGLGIIIPNDELIFFRGVGKNTTNQHCKQSAKPKLLFFGTGCSPLRQFQNHGNHGGNSFQPTLRSWSVNRSPGCTVVVIGSSLSKITGTLTELRHGLRFLAISHNLLVQFAETWQVFQYTCNNSNDIEVRV